MDNPLPLVFGLFCFAPLLIFFAGVWIGRGLPGLPFRLRFERIEGGYEAPARGRRRGQEDAWQP